MNFNGAANAIIRSHRSSSITHAGSSRRSTQHKTKTRARTVASRDTQPEAKPSDGRQRTIGDSYRKPSKGCTTMDKFERDHHRTTDPDTSAEGASAARRTYKSLIRRCKSALRMAGAGGLTTRELGLVIGVVPEKLTKRTSDLTREGHAWINGTRLNPESLCSNSVFVHPMFHPTCPCDTLPNDYRRIPGVTGQGTVACSTCGGSMVPVCRSCRVESVGR